MVVLEVLQLPHKATMVVLVLLVLVGVLVAAEVVVQ
jgi:hypothetical protein